MNVVSCRCHEKFVKTIVLSKERNPIWDLPSSHQRLGCFVWVSGSKREMDGSLSSPTQSDLLAEVNPKVRF